MRKVNVLELSPLMESYKPQDLRKIPVARHGGYVHMPIPCLQRP